MATTIQQIELPKKARALDTSGNNNHGQIYSGRGLEFDGVADYIHTPLDGNPGNFGNQSDFETTIAFWVKVNDFVGGNAFMQWARTGQVTDGSPFVLLALDGTDGSSRLYVDDAYHDLTHKFKAETWYRFVVTRAASDNTWRVYINGVADVTHDDSGTPNNQANANSFYLGTGYNRYFSGAFSNAQVWNKAFTQADVTYDYLNPESLALNNGGTALTESNLKLWYPMQDGHRGQQSYILDGANTGLGDEMISNGDFSDGTTGWTKATTASATQEIVDGKLRMYSGTAGDNSNQCSSTNVITAGKNGVMYRLTIDMSDPVGMANGSIRLDGAYDASNVISFGEGSNTVHFKAYRDFTLIKFIAASHSDYYTIDNVSLKPVNDKNHATTVFYGDDLWDGTQGDDANWSLFGNNTKAEDAGAVKITYVDNASGGYIMLRDANDLNADLVVGRTYIISFSTKVNQGSIVWRCLTSGGGTNALATAITSTSFETRTMTVVADHATDLYIHSYGMTTGDIVWIKDISVKEVGVASGWTDADQQLHIPQTALQSYNELLHGFSTETSGSTHVLIADNAALNVGEDDFSMSLWFKTDDDYDTYTAIWRKGGWGSEGYSLGFDASGNLAINTATTGNNDWGYTATTIEKGKWYHVVGVWDRSANQTLYLNGVEQTMVNGDISGNTGDLSNTSTAMIGSSANGRFTGCITEVALFKTIVLSDAEVLELYNDGKALDVTTHSQVANLTGYWRNNGLSTWNDLSTNSNNGTVTGTETILIPQGVDSSRDNQGFIMNRQKDTSCFNNTASGGYIEIPVAAVDDDLAFLGVGDGFSIQAWIKMNGDNNTDNTMIVSRNNNTHGYRFEFTTTGKISFGIEENGTLKTAVTDSAISIGTWYHVVGTFDGDPDNDGSGEIKLYLNGDTDGSVTNNNATSNDMYASISPMRIGKHFWAGAQVLDGQIDGVLIYNKVLSLEEVERNYNAGKGSHRN